MTTQQELDRIDQYLNGTLPEQERLAFEQQLAGDETLASTLTEIRSANEAIYYGSLAELKNAVAQDIKNIPYTPAGSWKTTRNLSIASLIVVSGITGYFIADNIKTNTANPESTVIQETQKSVVQERTGSGSGDSAIQKSTLATSQQTQTQTQETSGTNSAAHESLISDTDPQKQIQETSHTPAETKTAGKDSVVLKTVTPSVEVKKACDKSFTIQTSPSCKHSESGSITIQSDETTRYLYQVDEQNSSRGLFQRLSAGEHQVLVSYDKGCTYTKKITIEEKWCPMNESYSFNPDYNEKWTVKYEAGSSGTFTIFDRSGREIYSASFGSGNEQWNGTDLHGTIVPVGVYVASIRYADGRQEKVNLTIVR